MTASELKPCSIEIDGEIKWVPFHPIAGPIWLDLAKDTREEVEEWIERINASRGVLPPEASPPKTWPPSSGSSRSGR